MNFKYSIKFYLLFVLLLIVNFFRAQDQSNKESVSTVTYAVVSIPFSPCTFSTGTQILVNQDDKWSPFLNIGFNFNYFGNACNTFIVGSNGQISLDTSKATGIDSWSISGAIPSLANMPGNTICAAFRDIDPTSSGMIYYSTYGSSPNRYLVVSWDNIPVFSNPGNCTGIPNSSFQVVLHETSNCIDVFIKNSTTCPGWNGGYGIIGIQNTSGTSGYFPAGRNYPNAWTATNEGWRFIPSGSSCATACGVATGINTNRKDLDFEIYPNPSDGIYRIKTLYNEGYIEVKNFLGDEMHSQILNSREMDLDLRNLNKGIYYLRFLSKEGKIIYQTKIIKE